MSVRQSITSVMPSMHPSHQINLLLVVCVSFVLLTAAELVVCLISYDVCEKGECV